MSKNNFKIRADNLQLLINKNYKNINDFFVENNQDYSAVYRYLHGKMNIGNIMAKRIEAIFNLLAGDLDKPLKGYSNLLFNIYPTIGEFNSFDDIISQKAYRQCYVNADEVQSICSDTSQLIGLIINSDAMIPHLKENWLLLFKKCNNSDISDGKTYAFIFNKRVFYRDIFFENCNPNTLILKASNPEFPELKAGLSDINIIGEPVYICLGAL